MDSVDALLGGQHRQTVVYSTALATLAVSDNNLALTVQDHTLRTASCASPMLIVTGMVSVSVTHPGEVSTAPPTRVTVIQLARVVQALKHTIVTAVLLTP